MNATDTLARAAADYPYPAREGKTHYVGCWQSRGHHNCAVARVDRLETLVSEIKSDLKGGRRSAWQQKRDALERIRAWEDSNG